MPSDISKRTGFCVLLCRTDARSLIWPDAMTSTTFILTKSQPRSLLSMARLKSARSRWFSASSSRTLIAQTCLGLRGRFWPTIRPLFQAGEAHEWQVSLVFACLILRSTTPPTQRQPDVDKAPYHGNAAPPPRSVLSPKSRMLLWVLMSAFTST